MDSGLTILSSEEAVAKIMAGEALKGCSIAKLDLSDKEIPGPVSITECHIGQLNLINTTILGVACFDHSVFLDRVLAGWESLHAKTGAATFRDRVSFNHSVFQGKALFSGAKFGSISSFMNAVFQQEVYFYDAHFQEQVFFMKTRFQKIAYFRNATFGVEGHFDQCEFQEDVTFENAKFLDKEASFNHVVFDGDLNFLDTQFQGYLAFRKTIVQGEVDFKRALFQQDADFQDSQFKSKISFRDAKVQSKISFLHTIFSGLASFLATQFQDASFLNAQFHDEALFNYDRHTRASLNEASTAAHFAGCADFTNVRFLKRAVFEQIVFEKSAVFANAYFGEQASFIEAKFQGPACFNNVYCNQELSAIAASFGEITLDHANINRRLDLTDAAFCAISFYKASVDLIMVEMAQIRRKLINERPKNFQYERAQEEYLILKESFQQRGLAEEEDWSYRKFRQMKRKATSHAAKNRILRKTQNGSFIGALWRLFSNFMERIIVDRGTGYGTQPMNIAIVALSIIALFGYIYSQFPEEFVIDQPVNAIQAGPTLGLAQSIYFSFSTFTTMGLNNLQPKLDSPICYCTGIEAFLGIFLMTLFVGTYTRKIIR